MGSQGALPNTRLKLAAPGLWSSLLFYELHCTAPQLRRTPLGSPNMTATMDELSQEWMAYIDAEVRAACRKRGLESQVRRKWTVRDRPVSASSVDDYEWKLVLGANAKFPQDRRERYEGRYYVLWLDRAGGKFIFQHDSCRGDDGSEMPLATFTEIRLLAFNNPDYLRVRRETGDAERAARIAPPPPPGWLCETLVHLTERFQPNWFSIS